MCKKLDNINQLIDWLIKSASQPAKRYLKATVVCVIIDIERKPREEFVLRFSFYGRNNFP
jgi:hypothetical protein